MPTSLGPAEIMVILVVALIVLGPNRLPEAGRQVGKALAEVRRWTRDVQGEIKSHIDPEPDPVPSSTSASASAEAVPVIPEPEPAPVSLYPPPPDDVDPDSSPDSAAAPSEEIVSSRPPSGGPA